MSGRHRPTSHRHGPDHRGIPAPGRERHRWVPRPVTRLGIAGVLAIGLLGIPGTFAFWTAQRTMASTTFTSGILDIRLSGSDGNPVAWANASLTLGDMLPGESVAADFPVQNVGNVPLRYTATVTGAGTLASHLSMEAFTTGTASNGTSGGLRTGTCSGTGQGATALPGTLVGTAQQVPAGGQREICLVVTLDPTAPSSVQGTSATAEVTFSAAQVGAP